MLYKLVPVVFIFYMICLLYSVTEVFSFVYWVTAEDAVVVGRHCSDSCNVNWSCKYTVVVVCVLQSHRVKKRHP